MKIEDKNFVITKDLNAKDVLLQNNLTLVSDKDGLFVFVNEPKKFQKFTYESLPIRFTNKLYF